MKQHLLIPFIVVLAILAWLLFAEDPAAEVRDAHEELANLLSKSADEAGTESLLKARAVQLMFADPSEVTGDAEALSGVYAPDQLASIVIQLRGLFDTIDLVFSEPEIEFPGDRRALARFRADLVGRGSIDGFRERAESRTVISRMDEVDGEWLFSAFELTEVPPAD